MILDFWRWAFSDLKMRDVRDIFAQWMVAKLLGIPTKVRSAWDTHNLTAPNGVRIAVKAAAYLHTWSPTEQPARVAFSNLQAHQNNAQTPPSAEANALHADLYVFCVQVEKDPERWNALDLAQWRFYTVTGAEIALLGQKRLSLMRLRRLCAEMSAEALRTKGTHLIHALGKSYNAPV